VTQERSKSRGGNDRSSPAAPALSFVDVTKTFPNGNDVLAGVSLSVDHGQFVSIVGPSGCGKTTLLRLAAGLDQPTSGTCAANLRNLGYIFQDPTLLPWRTVKQNIELSTELGPALGSADESGLSVAEAIELVGLQTCANDRPHQLSGGMRMRASIARALVRQPSVLLFDEPFAALDEGTRQRLNHETLRLFVDQAFAALFVTHSIVEAVFLSTQVHVMSASPARITETISVPFPYPRPQELRFEPEFVELCRQLSEALRRSQP